MNSAIKKYLLQHPDLFICHISGCYPVTTELIDKYKDCLDWRCLTGNDDLAWSTDLFYRYEDYWSWGDPDDIYSVNIQDNPFFPMSLEILRKHKEKIEWESISQNTEFIRKYPELLDEFKELLHWDYISGNEKLIWSEKFIGKYADYWYWPYLSGNNAISWSPGLILKYLDKVDKERIIKGNNEPWLNIISRTGGAYLNPVLQIPGTGKYTKDELELILKEGNWYRMSWDERIPFTSGLIEYYRDNWDWETLSNNKSLPWSHELIEKHIDRWDFSLLSSNESLPWSEELIDAFEGKWDWGRLRTENYHTYTIDGLSGNTCLPWSVELIRKYLNKWFWRNLSLNEGISWNLEVLHAFEDFWKEEALARNTALWSEVFYPYLNNLVIDELMKQIIIKKKS